MGTATLENPYDTTLHGQVPQSYMSHGVTLAAIVKISKKLFDGMDDRNKKDELAILATGTCCLEDISYEIMEDSSTTCYRIKVTGIPDPLLDFNDYDENDSDDEDYDEDEDYDDDDD